MDSMSFMTDLAGFLRVKDDSLPEIKHSSNTRAGQDLDMSDYMKLMIATFQNQSIDDVASTSDMMNQMVQMSVIQAVTNLNKIVSESSSLNYAASLVGKEVTIGIKDGYELSKFTGEVVGTGMLDGDQVIFLRNGEMYKLSDVIAVGHIPDDLDATASAASTASVNSASDINSLRISSSETSERSDSRTDYSGDNYQYVDAGDGSMRIVYKGEDGVDAV